MKTIHLLLNSSCCVKKYLTETKRAEKMESEMRILKERVEHLTMMIEKKNHELEEMQEKGIAMSLSISGT